MSTVGAILQGGRSSRMGRDKSAVVVAGQPMREHVTTALLAVCDRVVQVGGAGADVVDDAAYVDGGPIAGVLSLLRSGAGDRYVVCAVDVPLIDGALLQRLIDVDDDACFAGHPLPLVVAASSLPRIEGLWAAGERRLSAVSRVAVDVDAGVEARLWNVNAPADVAEAERRLLSLR